MSSGRGEILESAKKSLDNVQPAGRKQVTSFRESYYKATPEGSEIWLTVSIRTTRAFPWAEVGHEVAHQDICVTRGTSILLPQIRGIQSPWISEGTRIFRLENNQCSIRFDKIEGRLKRWTFRGRDMIRDGLGPQLTFWRAPTDNDRGGAGQLGDWEAHRVSELTHEIREVRRQHKFNDHVYEILVESFISPPVLAWGFKTSTKYTFHSDGKLLITVSALPTGDAPGTVPRVGLEMRLPSQLESCQWFGLGPHQTYRDMKSAGKIGIWSANVYNMTHMYERPQDSGNRTETRWVEVTDERRSGIRAVLKQGKLPDFSVEGESSSSSDEQMNTPSSCAASEAENRTASDERVGFDFAISRYTATELDHAKHPYELPKSSGVTLRIDADHHGLGSASCGPDVLEQYHLKTREFHFTVSFEPVQG